MTISEEVLALKAKYDQVWHDKPDEYWYARVAEEMLELALSLRNQHDHSPEYELKQIAAMCLNWLEYRNSR